MKDVFIKIQKSNLEIHQTTYNTESYSWNFNFKKTKIPVYTYGDIFIPILK
jgi:hypothetical protein